MGNQCFTHHGIKNEVFKIQHLLNGSRNFLSRSENRQKHGLSVDVPTYGSLLSAIPDAWKTEVNF